MTVDQTKLNQVCSSLGQLVLIEDKIIQCVALKNDNI